MSAESRSVLRADRVHEIFKACMYLEGEDTTGHIPAEGLMMTVGIHPGRVEVYRQEIHDMLRALPSDFQEDGGGGTTFLNACIDSAGEQWASTHQTVDQLVMLGLAIGKVAYCLGRDMWPVLPGGVPYFVVKP